MGRADRGATIAPVWRWYTDDDDEGSWTAGELFTVADATAHVTYWTGLTCLPPMVNPRWLAEELSLMRYHYSGPGRSYANSPWAQVGKDWVMVTQSGGQDI